MRVNWTVSMMLVAAVAASACSGGGGNSSSSGGSPTAPSNPATTTSVTVTINGITGNQAYNPNPVKAASGSKLVFKNNTSVEHHLVMDDGSMDFGTIAAGASSAAMDLPPGGAGNYHCTNHPSMVGSINGDAAPEPPADGGSVDY